MSPDDKQQKRNGSRGMNTTSSSQQTLPLSHAPQMKSHYYNIDNGGRHHQMPPYENGNGYPSGQYANRYGNGKLSILIAVTKMRNKFNLICFFF